MDETTTASVQDSAEGTGSDVVDLTTRPLIAPIAVAIAIADQLTKLAICGRFGLGRYDHITVIPDFFDIRKVFNYGAAWGMMSGERVMLSAVAAGMLVLLWKYRRDFIKAGKLCRIGIGLLAGGVTGNLIDRVKLGYVVDFLDFHWKNVYTFPTFNIADTAICVGILLYFISTILAPKQKRE